MNKWRIALWVAIVAVSVAFLYAVRAILLPFVLAYVIAVLLDPVVRQLRYRGWSRSVAVIAITVAFFAVIGLVAVQAAPAVGSQLSDMQRAVTGLTDRISEESARDNLFLRWNPAVRAQPPGPMTFVDQSLAEFAPILERLNLPTTRSGLSERFLEPNSEQIGGLITGFFNGLAGLVGTAASSVLLLLFVPLFAFYFLLDMDRLRIAGASWIPPALRSDLVATFREVGDVFTRYLRGVTLAITVYVILMALLLSALGAPYSILLALISGAVYLIPFLGQLIANVSVLLVVGLSERTGAWWGNFDNPWIFAVWVFVVFVVANILWDQLVYPRVVGKAVGLHPLVSMFVVLSGAALFGLVGMLIAFPLAGAVKVVFERLLRISTNPSQEANLPPPVPLRHRRSLG